MRERHTHTHRERERERPRETEREKKERERERERKKERERTKERTRESSKSVDSFTYASIKGRCKHDHTGWSVCKVDNKSWTKVNIFLLILVCNQKNAFWSPRLVPGTLNLVRFDLYLTESPKLIYIP